MREEVKRYVDGEVSRRRFIQFLSTSGLSALAVTSMLESLAPIAHGMPAANTPAPSLLPFEGSGGELLAEQIKAAGVKYLFLGNGSGLGPLCDALVDRPDMQIILATHENHCVAMADGYAKATGRPSFAMFSRVGSPNATSNMYNSMKDRTPVVIATDHSDLSDTGRDGNEDIEDWLETVEQYTKLRWLVESPARIPEWVAKAFKVSSTMPGGPAYLRFPRDVMYARKVKSAIFAPGTFQIPMHLRPDTKDVEQTAKALLEAESPLLYVGSEVFASNATQAIVALADLLAIPVTQGRSWAADFPTNHPLFLGEYRASMRYPENVDVFINMGAHMPDPERFDRSFLTKGKIIHCRVETAHLGTGYPVNVPIAANVRETAKDLVESIKSQATTQRLQQIRDSRLEKTRKFAEAVEKSRVAAARRRWEQVPMTWERVSFEIDSVLDKDAYVVEEFGTNGPKSLQWFTFAEGGKTRIGRTIGRALGWGVGASIGVKLARPNNQVLSLQGDGGFLFGQAEALWTMSRYDIPIIIVIFNNRCYNETRVRMFGQTGRQAELQKDMLSYLGDPDVDFVKIASAFGVKGEQVTTPGQIKPAMSRAVKATADGRPYLIDAIVERSGAGADLNWYPDYSLAETRQRKA